MYLRRIIFIVASGGGHLTEANYALSAYKGKRIVLSNYNLHEKFFKKNNSRFIKIINPHDQLVLYLINFFQCLLIFFRYRPKIIFSTGAGIAIPMILIGKIFGSKIIFMESGCRVKDLSRTGSFIYKISDEFLVHWPELKEKYPKSSYYGGLL